MNAKIREAVEAAEMVLVGIGREFGPELPGTWGTLTSAGESDGEAAERELEDYCRSRFYSEVPKDHPVIRAYDSLRELIGVRPYFVVTLNTDDLIYRSKLEKDLIVAPCGSMGKLQCGAHILEAEEIRDRVLAEAKREVGEPERQKETAARESERAEESGTKEPGQPGWRKLAVCPQCGRPLRFHTIENEDYMESGYLPQWERYTRWLSCTLNRRLCILELGVDFRYPQVIRWPFEKTAFYNQKSLLVRVNSRFPQAAQELAQRTVSIGASPVEALLENAEIEC